MQITSVNNKPAKYGDLWWGTAIAGDDKFEWFYQPKLVCLHNQCSYNQPR